MWWTKVSYLYWIYKKYSRNFQLLQLNNFFFYMVLCRFSKNVLNKKHLYFHLLLYSFCWVLGTSFHPSSLTICHCGFFIITPYFPSFLLITLVLFKKKKKWRLSNQILQIKNQSKEEHFHNTLCPSAESFVAVINILFWSFYLKISYCIWATIGFIQPASIGSFAMQ